MIIRSKTAVAVYILDARQIDKQKSTFFFLGSSLKGKLSSKERNFFNADPMAVFLYSDEIFYYFVIGTHSTVQENTKTTEKRLPDIFYSTNC